MSWLCFSWPFSVSFLSRDLDLSGVSVGLSVSSVAFDCPMLESIFISCSYLLPQSNTYVKHLQIMGIELDFLHKSVTK